MKIYLLYENTSLLFSDLLCSLVGTRDVGGLALVCNLANWCNNHAYFDSFFLLNTLSMFGKIFSIIIIMHAMLCYIAMKIVFGDDIFR